MTRMKAIVTGMIASYPVGGVLWDYGQYALGLERLGYEVFYLEDTSSYTYSPIRREYTADCSYGVKFLAEELGRLSPTLGSRWHFRNVDDTTYGVSPDELRRALADADLFLNVSGGTLLRDEYMSCRRKVLIDTDPGWNHFRNYPRWDAEPNWQGTHGYRAHDHFFTYATRLGDPQCLLPDLGIDWMPTRPPVLVDCWKPEGPGACWTTVMTWKTFQETIDYNGVRYGTKEMEFEKIEQLPRHTNAKLQLAMGGAEAPYGLWREIGWSVVEAEKYSQTSDAYQAYVQSSRGEVSIAKNVYVATTSGWFSCRSVCYLAAARPVVVQDTGFSTGLPVGSGLLCFTNFEEAKEALCDVERNYDMHAEAAREVARSCFSAETVLGDLLGRIGLG